ncbi:hypothetical protein CNY67_09715 [Desulfovibrio sp. G11]|nr:hypothetical protein CNY67_09715 [Desulfovibrio sp. G11]
MCAGLARPLLAGLRENMEERLKARDSAGSRPGQNYRQLAIIHCMPVVQSMAAFTAVNAAI